MKLPSVSVHVAMVAAQLSVPSMHSSISENERDLFEGTSILIVWKYNWPSQLIMAYTFDICHVVAQIQFTRNFGQMKISPYPVVVLWVKYLLIHDLSEVFS